MTLLKREITCLLLRYRRNGTFDLSSVTSTPIPHSNSVRARSMKGDIWSGSTNKIARTIDHSVDRCPILSSTNV